MTACIQIRDSSLQDFSKDLLEEIGTFWRIQRLLSPDQRVNVIAEVRKHKSVIADFAMIDRPYFRSMDPTILAGYVRGFTKLQDTLKGYAGALREVCETDQEKSDLIQDFMHGKRRYPDGVTGFMTRLESDANRIGSQLQLRFGVSTPPRIG